MVILTERLDRFSVDMMTKTSGNMPMASIEKQVKQATAGIINV